MNNIVIIPARLGSKRFPNKILAAYQDKPILQHIIDLAKSTGYSVVLASEDDMLSSFAEENKILFFKCSARCGTERAYLFYKEYPGYDNYITIPADEPSIRPTELYRWLLHIDSLAITTAYCDFYCIDDVLSPKSCKLVTTVNNTVAYFSRSIIPAARDDCFDLSLYKKHVGLFCFPNDLLDEQGERIWSANTHLDAAESLEQNRFIELNIPVVVSKINHIGFGIDIPDQINALEKRMKER